MNSGGLASNIIPSSKMPAFTLYGARGSTNTDRVRLVLAEGGFTDYELVLLSLQKGEQKVGDFFSWMPTHLLLIHKEANITELEISTHQTKPNPCSNIQLLWELTCCCQSKEHKKSHPWGKVPVIVTAEGFTLYESRAICEYLTTKYSFPLLPSNADVEAVALFNQAQNEEVLYFAQPAGIIAFEKFAKKFMGLPPDDAAVLDALRSVEMFFDVVEPLLREKDYMAGNDFTLVDVYYIPLIQRLFACGYGDVIVTRDAVSAWWDRCTNRPGIQGMLAADKKALNTASS